MVVMLAYTYLGWSGGDQGWYQDILAQPSRRTLFDWGVWLGNRYKDEANMIWLGLGDFAPPTAPKARCVLARSPTGSSRPAPASCSWRKRPPPDSIPGEVPDFGPIVDQNSFYGYGPDGIGTVYETADRAWKATPTRPAWMQEGTYEYERQLGPLQRRAVGHTSRSVLVGARGWHGRGRLRLERRLAVAEHSGVAVEPRCELLHLRLRPLRIAPLVGARAVRGRPWSHGSRA